MAAIPVLLALFIAALPFNGSVFAARNQGAEALETTITEQEIRVSGPNFALEDLALEEYPHGRGERIYISSVSTLSFAEVSFFDDADTPEETIDLMMSDFDATSQEFAIIQSGNADRIFYSLAKFRISNDLAGYFYIEVAEDVSGTIDLLQSFYTLNEDFGEQLKLAREEISLDGNAFLGVTAINVEEAIASDEVASATPAATPGPVSYEYEWAESQVVVRPPLSLDYDSQNDVLESIFVSSDAGFAYIGYLKTQSESPESALQLILEGAPPGEEAPTLLASEGNSERIFAVYRIATDDGSTIMVIEITAAGDDLWQVEALAAVESEILTEVEVFQNSVTIDGTGFLDDTSVDEIETILMNNES